MAFLVNHSSTAAYVIDGVNNPTLTLVRGETYTFLITAADHPFWIKTVPSIGTSNAYSAGVQNNGMQNGTLTFNVPNNAPDTLYYNCQFHSLMAGTINIVSSSNPLKYFQFNDTSCHGLPSFISGLNYQLPTSSNDKVFIDLNNIVSGFYKNQNPIRNPNLISVSNLPNNIFYNTGSKYLQGYFQDEGIYNIKTHILESGVLCEKVIILNVINTGFNYLYKVNYPINIGFIKYNPLERLGVSTIPDSDARTYFAKTNISDRSVQNKISDFVVGLKNLNVWDKLENIWIFRSEYNLASGASGFIDLKNPNFSGYISSSTNLVDHRSSGYKFVNDNSRFNLSDSIRFTGANISMFSVLESIKTAPPHTPYKTLLGPESYQQSGFRFGINETLNFRKWFRLWNNESVPSNGFQVGTNATGQGSEYSFLSAGIQNSGTGFIQVNNESPSTSTGSYKEYGPGITAFPSLAGGTNVLPNRIAFFAISKQNILNNHSGLMNLVKSTICADLNL